MGLSSRFSIVDVRVLDSNGMASTADILSGLNYAAGAQLDSCPNHSFLIYVVF